MKQIFPKLRPDEAIKFNIRALFENNGYQLYRMDCFEEYGHYRQNCVLPAGDEVITFTDNGKLMALKPDVTLSIAKNTPAGASKRVYYVENVFRKSKQTGQFREISQIGLEFIGGAGLDADTEVLTLAVKTLEAIGDYAIGLSHGAFIDSLLNVFKTDSAKMKARDALRTRSPHLMRRAADEDGLDKNLSDAVMSVVEINGDYEKTIKQLKAVEKVIPAVKTPLKDLTEIYSRLKKQGLSEFIRLDFSVSNAADYYNGIVFQGVMRNLAKPVLSGGRYDDLLLRLGKNQGATGFALYLDDFGYAQQEAESQIKNTKDDFLNIALPKGRLGDKAYEMFEKAGFSCKDILQNSRKLIFEDEQNKVRYFLVKPGDVNIYVEHGAADIGVIGKDVLLESNADVLELLDLGFGKCRIMVAAKQDFTDNPAIPLRVATKYPAIAKAYFNRPIELIKLQGSIELAPLLNLSDVIVDIVETGSTIRENNLKLTDEIASSSARLIVNRVSWRFKESVISGLVKKLEEQL